LPSGSFFRKSHSFADFIANPFPKRLKLNEVAMRELLRSLGKHIVSNGQFEFGPLVNGSNGISFLHALPDHEIHDDRARKDMLRHSAGTVGLIHNIPLRAGVDNRMIAELPGVASPFSGGTGQGGLLS
jgi:hypothetical protein